MIALLTGEVVAMGGTWMVVQAGGLGFRALCTPATVSSARVGAQITVHTSLVVREDSLTLYGFARAEERDCFELAQTASGIGPRIALAIVSVLGPADFSQAVRAGDTAAITRVPGIGAKGAAKLILELKDKVMGLAEPDSSPSAETSAEWRDQVTGGLESLGYSAKDAARACDQVAKLADDDPTVSVAVLLRAALRSLAK